MQDKTLLTTINEILHPVKIKKQQEEEQTQDQDDVMQFILDQYTLDPVEAIKPVKLGTKRIYWNASDTDKFYAALKKYGTNFSLIKLCFPKYNRRQIRIKYKHELKYRPVEIALAIQVYKERF